MLHEHHICNVLERLHEHHLYEKPEKCKFNQDIVDFLRHIISPRGLTMDLCKVATTFDWVVPQDVHGTQRFPGFAIFTGDLVKGFLA